MTSPILSKAMNRLKTERGLSRVVEASVSTSNIFQADQSQKLTQVSCQTAIPGTTVSYEVYLLSDSFTDPQDGLRVASEEETYEFGGFHKISLSTPVLLQKGQKYSIVITQIVPDGRYAFSMQYGVGETLAEFMDKTHWQKGIINKEESFICIDGEWLDLDDPELLERLSEGSYDLYECDNFPIKGYSEKVAEMPVIKITGVDELSFIEPNKSLTLSLRFHGPSADFPEEPKITWSVPDEYGEILSVEPRDDSGSCDKAVVTAKGYGTGLVTVEVEDVGTAVIKITSVRHKIKRVTFEGGINKFEYTGEPITPKVIPECEHWCADLEEGKDYEVSYENNIEPGTATAIVTGVGDHQSVVRKTFTIEKTGDDPVPCDEHDFGEWRILKDPTCAEMGTRERECSVCGYVETEEIPTIAHTMEEFSAIEPSCTQDGNDLYYRCITCGNYYEDAEGTTIIEEGSWIVPATGHKWGDWYEAKPSTCVKKGQMARACLNDPEHVEYAETDLLTHKLQKINAVEPTCMGSGKIEYWLCDSCGQLFADKDGKEVITEKDTIVPAKGHDWDDVIIVEQPTCTTSGVRTYTCTCSDCGEIYSETKELPALGHNFSEWTTTKKASEIAEGQQARRCSVCGATETEVLPQLKPTLTSVKISKLTAGKKSATVKWKKLSKTKLKKISKIQIQYSTSKDFSTAVKTKYVSAKKTSYKIKSLKKGKKYYVRIRAYKNTGGEVHVSKWSKVKYVKAK